MALENEVILSIPERERQMNSQLNVTTAMTSAYTMWKKDHPADPSQPIESWERNSNCLRKKKSSAKPVLVGVWILKSLLFVASDLKKLHSNSSNWAKILLCFWKIFYEKLLSWNSSESWWQVEQNRTERIFEVQCGYNYVRDFYCLK